MIVLHVPDGDITENIFYRNGFIKRMKNYYMISHSMLFIRPQKTEYANKI